jgi:hypothetical protein
MTWQSLSCAIKWERRVRSRSSWTAVKEMTSASCPSCLFCAIHRNSTKWTYKSSTNTMDLALVYLFKQTQGMQEYTPALPALIPLGFYCVSPSIVRAIPPSLPRGSMIVRARVGISFSVASCHGIPCQHEHDWVESNFALMRITEWVSGFANSILPTRTPGIKVN